MTLTSELVTLARYLAGEFDNKEQAIADPVWYVHLRLWHRPIPQLLFPDSITFYAEQASIVNLNQPYRPRVLQLKDSPQQPGMIEIQYYLPKNIQAIQGAGQDPQRLDCIRPDQLEFLPGCLLQVDTTTRQSQDQPYQAVAPFRSCCRFTYQNQQYQVKLGFKVTPDQFWSYDQGIDPATGRGLWGALLGPFEFSKRQDFAPQLSLPA